MLVALAIPLGLYMAKVFAGEAGFLRWAERPIFALAGIKPEQGQHWSAYALALIAFNAAGFVLLFLILKFQDLLPWNPLHLPGLSGHLAFNTAVSFVTNTNWQSYGGETTMSYFSQMAGLTTQNFVSSATGMAVAAAVARGLASKQQKTIGNFWADMVRATLYILLPISIVLALVFVWQGMPQTLQTSLHGHDARWRRSRPSPSARSPASSRSSSSAPMAAASSTSTRRIRSRTRRRSAISCRCWASSWSRRPSASPSARWSTTGGRASRCSPRWACCSSSGWAASTPASCSPIGSIPPTVATDAGNMEGKEVRFGVANSALWAEATTAASNGSVNAMHDSFNPLGGMIAMLNIELGEVVFGGVGVGLTGMLLLVIVTVFLAGLMVGRTPEYLGKKIEAREVKLAALTLLVMPIGVLAFSALSIVVGAGQSAILNPGPHGLTELLYAYSSATGNNGSAFAGFTANVDWHNAWLGIAMLLGRYGYIIPILAIAGSLAAKKTAPASAGTFPTHGPVFVTLLVATIVIVGALTFLPVLALGPIAEQVSIAAGQSF